MRSSDPDEDSHEEGGQSIMELMVMAMAIMAITMSMVALAMAMTD